jgi:uncharacterized membrane protein YhaH (DUF805 family)
VARLVHLFAFTGRTARAPFWITYVVGTSLLFFAANLSTLVGTVAKPVAYVLIAAMIPVLVAYIATIVRRLHDRNRTGWWAIAFIFVPGFLYGFVMGALSSDVLKEQSAIFLLIVALLVWGWGLIELGVLRGTVGPNRYGEDPLGSAA